jgi:hypothetical protein
LVAASASSIFCSARCTGAVGTGGTIVGIMGYERKNKPSVSWENT